MKTIQLVSSHFAPSFLLKTKYPLLDAQTEWRRKSSQMQKDLSDAQQNRNRAAEQQSSLKRRIESWGKSLASARSRILVMVVEHRNMQSSRMVRRDFENNLRDMGQDPSESTPLQVFCVASKIFLGYCDRQNNSKALAFPTRQHTEIPKLRDWLIGFTLKVRERHAQSSLDSIEDLMSMMKPWISDSSAEVRLSVHQRESLETKLQAPIQALEEVCHLPILKYGIAILISL